MKTKSRLYALIALSLMFTLTQFASADTITVDGTKYDVTILVTSYNASAALFQSQPWWDTDGGSDAATAALDVASFFALPNSIGGVSTGPLFLWPGAGVSFVAFNQFGGTSAGQLNTSTNYTFAIATRSTVPDSGSAFGLLLLALTALLAATRFRALRLA